MPNLHTFHQPLPPMSMQHMPSLSHQPMSDQAQQDSIDRARAYKSRNKRPCVSRPPTDCGVVLGGQRD